MERTSSPNLFELKTLSELRSRPLTERVEKLERRDLIERPETEAKVLAELGKVAQEVAQVRAELEKERTAPRRVAHVLAIAISTAVANLLAQWGLEPPKTHTVDPPTVIERRGP